MQTVEKKYEVLTKDWCIDGFNCTKGQQIQILGMVNNDSFVQVEIELSEDGTQGTLAARAWIPNAAYTDVELTPREQAQKELHRLASNRIYGVTDDAVVYNLAKNICEFTMDMCAYKHVQFWQANLNDLR